MDLIQEFMDATAHLRSPPIFRTWAGIGMVSAAMSKCVWTSIAPGKRLYGNTFSMLVGPPGCGKSEAINAVKEIISLHPDTEQIQIGPNSMTFEAGMQRLGEHFAKPEDADDEFDPMPLSFSFMNDELGSLFKRWEPSHIQTLADLWDIRPRPAKWENITKTQGKDLLYHHYITMLVGAQPGWLSRNMPPDFFHGGMGARFVFVYSDKKIARKDVSQDYDPHAAGRIAKKLRLVSRAEGEFPFAPEAMAHLNDWQDAGMPPAPTDPILENYAVRRHVHVGKLALIIAVSRHPDLRRVTMDDLQAAYRLLFDTEQDMPRALAFAGNNPNRAAEITVAAFVRDEFARTQTAVPERRLRIELGRAIPTQHVGDTIDEMIKQGRIVRAPGGFRPGATQ